jgi:DNA-binding transcriptional MerR regulator
LPNLQEIREYMKDSIVLQGRIYECTKLVQQRFGLDDQTLRKWAKKNIVPSPVRLGNKCFYDREAIESKILTTCQD